MNTKRAVVVGLGYVGLPLAVLAQEKGWQVTGVDIDEPKVKSINDGIVPFVDVELTENLKKFPILASTDAASVKDADVVIIAVPTPVTHDKMPDLKPLISATKSILPYLKVGQALIIESTINPGVMDEAILPLLRERQDLPIDADTKEEALYIMHCPERVNPGDKKWTVRTIPRVLGGYSEVGTKIGKEFYESILDAQVMVMGSVTEAEAVKILENTFRDINIAFINEMAKSFAKLGIDVTNVIAGAATKPFAFMPHYPGNGVGGHCISVDPYYMIERGRQAGFDHEFLKLARAINDSMPHYTVELVDKALQEAGITKEKPVVALLGLAYKKDIDDLRESPALEIRTLLQEKGVELRVFDPHVPAESTVASLEEALQGVDVIMLATNHTVMIERMSAAELQATGAKVVIDGKNALDKDGIKNAGLIYYGIGR